MNREIKFRIWYYNCMECDTDDWRIDLQGNLFCLDSADGTFNKVRRGFEYKLMQFTGLKDKNGREIYEGDILSFKDNMTSDDSLGLEPNGYIYDENSKHSVMWNEKLAGWEPNFDDDDEWKYKRDTRGLMLGGLCEVIGNIYENPELISHGSKN